MLGMRPVRPDHPRIRGEHGDGAVLDPVDEGSSPHTRGAQFFPAFFDGGDGIIPAYAGSTIKSGFGAIKDGGSSPHTRGARSGFRLGG